MRQATKIDIAASSRRGTIRREDRSVGPACRRPVLVRSREPHDAAPALTGAKRGLRFWVDMVYYIRQITAGIRLTPKGGIFVYI